MSSIKRALQEFVEGHIYANQTLLVEKCLGKGILFSHDIENLRKSGKQLLAEYSREAIAAGDVEDWKEIYEWWLVSHRLAEKLKQHDEPIVRYGLSHWWGRQDTRQSIYLDYVISRIFDEGFDA